MLKDPEIATSVASAPEPSKAVDTAQSPRLDAVRTAGNKQELLAELARKIVAERETTIVPESPLVKAIQSAMEQEISHAENSLARKFPELMQGELRVAIAPDVTSQSLVERLSNPNLQPAQAADLMMQLIRERPLAEVCQILVDLRHKLGDAAFAHMIQSLGPESRALVEQLSRGDLVGAAVSILSAASPYEVPPFNVQVMLLGMSQEDRNSVSQGVREVIQLVAQREDPLVTLVKLTSQLNDHESIVAQVKLIELLVTRPHLEVQEVVAVLQQFSQSDIEKLSAEFLTRQQQEIYDAFSRNRHDRDRLEIGLALQGAAESARDVVIDQDARVVYEQVRLGKLQAPIVKAISVELREAQDAAEKALAVVEEAERRVSDRRFNDNEGDVLLSLSATSKKALEEFRRKSVAYRQTADWWISVSVGLATTLLCKLSGLMIDESVLLGVVTLGMSRYVLSFQHSEKADPQPIIEEAKRRKRGSTPLLRSESRGKKIREARRRRSRRDKKDR